MKIIGLLGILLFTCSVWAQTTATGDAEFNDAITQLKETFGGLRGIVYIVSGFSLMGFAFAAMYGKIKWSWVAIWAMCLFILAMAEPLVNYLGEDIDGFETIGSIQTDTSAVTDMDLDNDQKYGSDLEAAMQDLDM